MPSAIDATKPVNGVDAVKEDLRANLAAAEGEINHGGFFEPATGVERMVGPKLNDIVSVKDFGAVGNGVTDDTEAIRAATNEIISRGGGTIYFPPGDYIHFTGGIGSHAAYPIASNVRYLGYGAKLIYPDLGANGGVRPWTTPTGVLTENIIWEGLEFEHEEGGYESVIALIDSRHCQVINCTMRHALVFTFADASSTFGNRHHIFRGCRFINPDYRTGSWTPPGTGGRAAEEWDFYGTNATLTSLFPKWLSFLLRFVADPFDGASATIGNRNMIVEDCYFEGAAYAAVEFAGPFNRNCVVSRCHFFKNYGTAIEFDKGAAECIARDNFIEDMEPTEAFGAGEQASIQSQDADTLTSNGFNNITQGNRFLQNLNAVSYRSGEYRKFQIYGYGYLIADNVVMEGDAGGDFLKFNNDLGEATGGDFTIRGNSTPEDATSQIRIFGGTVGRILIEDNRGGLAGLIIQAGTHDALIIRNNHWYLTGTLGQVWNTASPSYRSVTVEGNTIIDNGATNPLLLLGGADIMKIRDNIFDDLASVRVSGSLAVELAGNNFQDCGERALRVTLADTIEMRNHHFDNTGGDLAALTAETVYVRNVTGSGNASVSLGVVASVASDIDTNTVRVTT